MPQGATASGPAALILMPDWAGLRSALNARLDVIEAGLRAVVHIPVIVIGDSSRR
jgi:hypothetical protein